MEIRKLASPAAPAAIGPYSQAIAANGFVFCSGQLGLDPATGSLAAGVRAQAEQSILNIAAILASEKLGLDRVVKATVFLADMSDFAAVNEVYVAHFGASLPARSAVEVAALPKGGLVEIEVIAAS